MSVKHRWWALTLLVVAQFMIVLDVSIMNVALPSIEKTLGLGVTDLQWIVSAYTLAFGGFLLLGGRAADLFGRRRVFILGVVGFSFVSFVIGVSNSAALMAPLRAVQGLCAAFMSPAALSLVLTLFPDGPARTRALSVWGAVSAAGATVGLLLGGILTQYLSWRWNFFVNVPVGVLVTVLGLRFLPAHIQEERSKTLDLPGAALVTTGLILLVYTLTKAATWGWMSFNTLGLLGLGVFLLIAFAANEATVKHPLAPLSFFRVGNVAAADILQLPITASLFSLFFFLSLYVQNVLHYSPLQSGLAFLPMSLTIGLAATLAPNLIRRTGYKPLLIGSPLLIAAALFWLGGITTSSTYFDFLPQLIVMAVGMGLCFIAITVAATANVPAHESGLASGLLNTAQQIGGALGLAILSSVAASSTANAVRGGGVSATDAMLSGFHSAFYVGACFAVAASVIALVYIREQRDAKTA